MTLDQLKTDTSATIQKIAKNSITPKLVEMGLYPGKTIKVIFKAPFGDPIAIETDGYTLSLRKIEASYIEVQ